MSKWIDGPPTKPGVYWLDQVYGYNPDGSPYLKITVGWVSDMRMSDDEGGPNLAFTRLGSNRLHYLNTDLPVEIEHMYQLVHRHCPIERPDDRYPT